MISLEKTGIARGHNLRLIPKGRGNRVSELKKDFGEWVLVCVLAVGKQARKAPEKQPDSLTHLHLASGGDLKTTHVVIRGFLPLKEQSWPSGVKADVWQVMIMTIYYHP